LEETMRRVRRLSPRAREVTNMTIPANLHTVMIGRSSLWRWQLTEDGVALVPVAEIETEKMATRNDNPLTPRLRYNGHVDSSLPSWVEPKLVSGEPVLE